MIVTNAISLYRPPFSAAWLRFVEDRGGTDRINGQGCTDRSDRWRLIAERSFFQMADFLTTEYPRST
jgi:hypothetical protein